MSAHVLLNLLNKLCTLIYAYSSFAIILMGKSEPNALLSLSSWCLEIVAWLFLAVTWVSLQFVIVVFRLFSAIAFYLPLHKF